MLINVNYMGSNYKKIEYEVEGPYGSTENKWLYIKSNRSSDYTTFFDENGNILFSYGEFGNFDMGNALVIALTNWNDERMKDLTIDEIQKIKL